MKRLMIFTSIIVLAAGCASNKNAGGYGAPGANVTTETGTSKLAGIQPTERGYEGWLLTQHDCK